MYSYNIYIYVCLRCGDIVPSCVLLHILRSTLSHSHSLSILVLYTRAHSVYIHYTVYRTRRIYTAPATGVTFVPTRNVWCAPTCLRFQLHGLFPTAPLPTDRPRRRRLHSPYIIFYYIYFRVIIYKHRTEINVRKKP